MNKVTRVLTMVGMGLLAGAAIGAGPAQAATASGQTAAKPTGNQVQKHHNRDWVAGHYRSLRSCELAGRIGERFNQWDDYDCDYVRFGFRRGSWVLTAQSDRNWFRPGHGQHGNGHDNNGGHDDHGRR